MHVGATRCWLSVNVNSTLCIVNISFLLYSIVITILVHCESNAVALMSDSKTSMLTRCKKFCSKKASFPYVAHYRVSSSPYFWLFSCSLSLLTINTQGILKRLTQCKVILDNVSMRSKYFREQPRSKEFHLLTTWNIWPLSGHSLSGCKITVPARLVLGIRFRLVTA